MSDKKSDRIKTAYEYAIDSCGFNVTEDTIIKVYELFIKELKEPKDTNKK